MASDENPRTADYLLKPLFLWFFAGLIFWFVEFIYLVASDFAIFGATKAIGTILTDKSLLELLIFYPLLFVFVGIAWHLAGRIIRKRFATTGKHGWHPGGIAFFFVAVAGTFILQSVILPAPPAVMDLVWEAFLLGVGAASLAGALKLTGKDRRVGLSGLMPAAFVFVWFVPVFRSLHDNWNLFYMPVAFLIFVAVGVGLFLLVTSIENRTCRKAGAGINVYRWVFGIIVLVEVALIFSPWAFCRRTSLDFESLQSEGPRPNIILIVLDTVRGDHLSCYGYPRPTTPVLDDFAEHGVLFEYAMAPNHWTLPSHASMFTGQYPGEHLATGKNVHLDLRYPTIAEVLYKAGYQTAGVSANVWLSEFSGLIRGFQYFESSGSMRKRSERGAIWEGWKQALRQKISGLTGKRMQPERDYKIHGHNIVDRAIRWLKNSREKDTPFFLFMNLMDAHAPYHVPQHGEQAEFFPDMKSYREAVETSANKGRYRYNAGDVNISRREFSGLVALYDAQIKYMDKQLARFFTYLQRHGLWNNSIIIVTSDHGEYFGEHDFFGHAFLGGFPTLNAPLIIMNLPGYKPGARVEELVSLVDLFPTVLDVLKLDGPAKARLPGRSLRNLKKGRSSHADSYPRPHALRIIEEYSKEAAEKYYRQHHVIWKDGYQYRWSTMGMRELHYIFNDPGEKTNLVNELPELAGNMEAKAEKLAERSAGAPAKSTEPRWSEEDKARLRALGYIK